MIGVTHEFDLSCHVTSSVTWFP